MNKKLFLISFIVVATAMLATSCQKEEGTVTLGAKIQKPINGNAKVYIDDHTPCWHNADEVYINNAVYPVMAASGSSARIENIIENSSYRAIYLISHLTVNRCGRQMLSPGRNRQQKKKQRYDE